MSNNQSSAAQQKNTAPSIAVSQLEDWHEFIPFHSHYNPHTILNKNGELMQIIKISGNLIGSPCENLDGVHASVRATIRHLITKTEYDDKFSFWLHTIRKRVAMESAAAATPHPHPGSFSEYVDEQWQAENKWDCYYQNEIFLSILYEGETIPLADGKKLKNLVFPKKNRRSRSEYLAETYEILDSFTLSVMEIISSQLTAHRLTIVERPMSNTGKVSRPHIFYSEPLEFMGNLVNMRSEPHPLPDLDLSVAVQKSKISFGSNAIEAKNRKDGSSRFCAMLTLKQYIDSYVEAIDCIMQSPQEFIISESFHFIDADNALKHYKDQKVLFGMSGDIKLNKNFGITQMLGVNRNRPVDYCSTQTSIRIISNDLEQLDNDIYKFLTSFAPLGLLAVREDIMMDECFFAQLPGNFNFIRRATPLATEYVGGFSRLNRFHAGHESGNHWGNHLALLPTSVGSPYFFNFHVQDNGHTAIFDFNSFSDNTGKILQYFLLAKTCKFGTKLVIFDRQQSARLFMNKMGGTYYTMGQLEKNNKNTVTDNSRSIALNPFTLEASNYNRSFLAAWCGLLISPDATLDPSDKQFLSEAITKLYEQDASARNLPNLIKILSVSNQAIAQSLEKWTGKGLYAGLFDFEQESLDVNLENLGFDMTPALMNPAYGLPLFAYLMHRVINSVNGQPTVIVLNEAWDLLENAFFAPRLESLMEMLKQKNVMLVFTTSKPLACRDTITLSAVMNGTATKLYIPDDMPANYKSDDVGLNAQDDILLSDMRRQKGDFLLKQNGESVALKIFINEAEDIVAILTNDIKSLGSARGRFTGVPKDY